MMHACTPSCKGAQRTACLHNGLTGLQSRDIRMPHGLPSLQNESHACTSELHACTSDSGLATREFQLLNRLHACKDEMHPCQTELPACETNCVACTSECMRAIPNASYPQ